MFFYEPAASLHPLSSPHPSCPLGSPHLPFHSACSYPSCPPACLPAAPPPNAPLPHLIPRPLTSPGGCSFPWMPCPYFSPNQRQVVVRGKALLPPPTTHFLLLPSHLDCGQRKPHTCLCWCWGYPARRDVVAAAAQRRGVEGMVGRRAASVAGGPPNMRPVRSGQGGGQGRVGQGGDRVSDAGAEGGACKCDAPQYVITMQSVMPRSMRSPCKCDAPQYVITMQV